MPTVAIGPQAWGVYHPQRGWLVDTCAGGTWSWDVEESMWFPDSQAAGAALVAAEIPLDDTRCLRLK